MAILRAIAAICILFSVGCARIPLERARSEFYSGRLNRSDLVLEECKAVSKRDRLLCYMEGGISLYDMEAYEESADVLLKASKLIEKQDLVSITNQSTAVLINDKTMVYKGEYSERLWVHTFLIMSFLLQHNYESALVEAKQALELYDRYPDALEDDYFTRALIALCYENMNLPDDARIEYDKLAAAMREENCMPGPITPGKGELVLFIGQGGIPTKISIDTILPPSIRISIPRYTESYPPFPVTIRSYNGTLHPIQITTDMGDVAQRSLNERAAKFLTRQTLRAGLKEFIAQQVSEKYEFAEPVIRALFFLSEEADTRSWETLPGSLTLVRVTLDSGIHNLEISSEYSGTVYLNEIDIPEGKRLYRSFRF